MLTDFDKTPGRTQRIDKGGGITLFYGGRRLDRYNEDDFLKKF